ncbi:J domain-containing protein [Acidomonas methanolica]|uniref:J domain-containing protein n=1 Tax=Acidomonas methanolica TaxID=437 RepID=UPI00211A3702|nr:J domain-containing protein [Acidomonas methanolica]MCQ9154556.1 J domain-containing protein [Acidomonas methanolica]
MYRKSTRHRAFDPDPAAPETVCEMPGCTARAGYRAPRSRDSLNDYVWFCLDHVRDYNARWDYYKGMSPGQIEAHIRADTAWQRPSWKLGTRAQQGFSEEDVLDPLDLLSRRAKARAADQAATPKPPPPLRQPLSTLGLDWPVSLDDLKSRYKSLARQHHPDTNGGDKAAEERFKAVNIAYAVIRAHLRETTAEFATAKAG